MILCSILIPTRCRVDRLHRTLLTIRATARVEQFEVLLRVDYDDVATLSRIQEFERYGNVRVVVSGRGIGYNDLNLLYDDISEAARGKWVWFLNDDCEVSGVGWADRLAKLPLKKMIVQAENYQLGGSLYREHVAGAFPILPRDSWQELGSPMVPFVMDVWLDRLCKNHGWRTFFIRGLTTKHSRDVEADLQEHRKFTVPPISTSEIPISYVK